MKEDIRVFCGYVNTGGIAYKIAEGLRKYGIRADSLVIDDHSFTYGFHKKLRFIGSKPGFINRIIKYYYFIKHALIYDVFIFNTRSTLLSRKGDLKILRFLGKKTAMIFVGCDIRDKDHYLRSPIKYTACKNCTIAYQEKINCIMDIKKKESALIEKNTDAVFSHPFDAMILKDKFNYLYLMLEVESYNPKFETNKKIKILHVPSDDGIKGTNYVLAAIDKLKTENAEFEFELLRNKTHAETIEAIRSADILIDQMVAGWYGLISIEAMALGKTTVCYLRDELYSYIPDIPIVNLNPDNLAEGLKKLIAEKEKLSEYGKKGRSYAEKYHDHIKNSAAMLKTILAACRKEKAS